MKRFNNSFNIIFLIIGFLLINAIEAQSIRNLLGNTNNPNSSINYNQEQLLLSGNKHPKEKLITHISQGFLDSIKQDSSNSQIPCISVKINFNQYVNQEKQKSKHKRQHIHAYYKNDKRTFFSNEPFKFIEGRLIAVDSAGLYLYDSYNKTLSYVSFSKIQFVRKGRTLDAKVLRDAVIGMGIGAVLGGVGILGFESSTLFLEAVSGAAAGFVCGLVANIPERIFHEYQNTLPDVKFYINQDQNNANRYLEMLKQREETYGTPLFYEDFPNYKSN